MPISYECNKTCEYCGKITWCELREDESWQCRGCKIVAYFRWMYSFIDYQLLAWQEHELRSLYGTVDPDTGLRKYRRAYIEISKKNGKSFLIGGLPIYHLLMEDVRKPEAFGAGANQKSASQIFKASLELIDANPELKKHLRPLVSVKRIVKRDGSGFYQVMSTEPKSASGVEPSLLVIDELHRWSGAKADEVWNELWKGQISRAEPFGVMTTTAGSEDESLLWNQERDFAKSVIAREIESSSYYASIYQADERRVLEDDEYWMSREARVTANPSHEDHGGFLRDDALKGELDKVLIGNGAKNDYLRYHLGIKVSGTQESAIDMPKWIASGERGGVDLRDWPTYDYELLASKWNLVERLCVVGVDAAWSIDLASVAAVFPPNSEDPLWRALVWFWMPRANVKEFQTKHNVAYSAWIKKGFITACEGNVNDFEAIKERIKWCNQMFECREVAYDPWNFRATAGDLANDGIVTAEVPQNFGQLTEATKMLIGAYRDSKFVHGNNPVLNWNARCLALQADRKSNVQPAKPDQSKSKKRIDGMAAIITAMSRARHLVQDLNLDEFLSDPVRA